MKPLPGSDAVRPRPSSAPAGAARQIRVAWAVLALGVIQSLGPASATAQRVPPAALSDSIAAAVLAYDAGRYAEAEAFLATAAPGHRHPDLGPAALWLGRVYQQTQQPGRALDAWADGWHALRRDHAAESLLLADAYVWNTFAGRDSARYADAADAFLTLLLHLEAAPRLPPIALAEVRARYVGPLALVLPDTLRPHVFAQDSLHLAPGRVPDLLRWWRSQDPVPFTPGNERLHEHLERVAHAAANFPGRDRLFDARGRLYVRFGEPERRGELDFSDVEMGLHTPTLVVPENPWPASRNRTAIAVTGFRDAEFWVYRRSVHAQASYFFVHDKGEYHLAEPQDAIPLRYRASSSARHTDVMLMAADKLYTKLALLHPEVYSQRLMALERPDRLPLWTKMQQARGDGRRAAPSRDRVVPPARTRLFDDVEPLPVEVRLARFLDPDGTTRTELYWGLQARAVFPRRAQRRRLEQAGYEPSDLYLLDAAATQQSLDYRPHARTRRHHLLNLQDAARDPSVVLAPRTLVVTGDTGRYHLAAQWEAFWAYRAERENGDEADGLPGTPPHVTASPRLKLQVTRFDSLTALSPDPSRLEMSDLRPLRLRDGAPLEAAEVYPNRALTTAITLGLYFEAYHLTLSPDGQAHYDVAYEIVRGDGDRQTLASSSTRYTAPGRTARETVILDLEALGTYTGPLDVRVRITDGTTGQTVERTLAFEVVAK